MQDSKNSFQKPPVRQIVDRIIGSRRISRTDQQILMSVLLSSESLSPEEQNMVQQIYQDLKIGLIRVVE